MGCCRLNLNPPRARFRSAFQSSASAGAAFLRKVRARRIFLASSLTVRPPHPCPSPPAVTVLQACSTNRRGERGRTGPPTGYSERNGSAIFPPTFQLLTRADAPMSIFIDRDSRNHYFRKGGRAFILTELVPFFSLF